MSTTLVGEFKLSFMRKPLVIIYGLVLVASLIIYAFNKPSKTIDDLYLKADAPFGLSWRTLAETHSGVLKSDCPQLVETLGALLTATQKERTFSKCLNEHVSNVSVPHDKRPTVFRDGEITMDLLRGVKPVQYTYHYLNDLTYGERGKKVRMRQARG